MKRRFLVLALLLVCCTPPPLFAAGPLREPSAAAMQKWGKLPIGMKSKAVKKFLGDPSEVVPAKGAVYYIYRFRDYRPGRVVFNPNPVVIRTTDRPQPLDEADKKFLVDWSTIPPDATMQQVSDKLGKPDSVTSYWYLVRRWYYRRPQLNTGVIEFKESVMTQKTDPLSLGSWEQPTTDHDLDDDLNRSPLAANRPKQLAILWAKHLGLWWSIAFVALSALSGVAFLVLWARRKTKTKKQNTLHDAVKRDDTKAVERMLARRELLTSLNEDQHTPLQCAVMVGNAGMVKLLLARGADVNHCVRGETALAMASERGNMELVKMLLEARAKANEGALLGAVKTNQIEVVKLLLSRNADANRAFKNGITPLHVAVDEGYQELVSMLIAAGANVNAEDARGTPLFLATNEVRMGDWYPRTDKLHADIAQLLTQHGAIEKKTEASVAGGRNALAFGTPKRDER